MATLPSMRMRVFPCQSGPPSVSGLQRALPKGDHVGAEKACLLTARTNRCALHAVARLEPIDHEIAVLEAGVGRALKRVNEGAVVGDVGGEGTRRDGGVRNASERRTAVEAMGGAVKEAQRCLASRKPDGLQVALHLHGRAPLVAISHQDPNFGVSHGWIEELVPRPGIGRQYGLEPVARPDARVGKAAAGGSENGRPTAAVALRTDAEGVDLRSGAQYFPRGKYIIGACRKRILRLVGDG